MRPNRGEDGPIFYHRPATTGIYTLSLHDALPIFPGDTPLLRPATLAALVRQHREADAACTVLSAWLARPGGQHRARSVGLRSEEHTSELQSQSNLVCRLLLEKNNSSPVRP